MPGLRIKSVTLGFIKIIVDDYLYVIFNIKYKGRLAVDSIHTTRGFQKF